MKNKDPYGVFINGKFRFTLKKICEIIDEKETNIIPSIFRHLKDAEINRITADNMPAKTGLRVLFDLSWNKTDEESRPKIIEYIKDGVIVFSNRKFIDNDGNRLETVYIENPWDAWIAIGKYVKKVFPMPTIAITGSAGKTTCTMFAQCVFNEKYNVFISGEDGKNFNTPLQIVNQWVLRANESFNFHIQECGGETPQLIETSAKIIKPDAFAINNIDTTQHIATYGTPERLIEDKTSFDRVRKENTFGVINLDDEILKNFNFNSPIITYAVKNKNADFVAENIIQNGRYLEFDVVSKEEIVHIKINIVGEYNVYNALMVFALAKKFNLTNEEIKTGFLKYKSVGIRQNLQEIAGRLLYMDCYNASVESTTLAVKTLSKLKTKNGRRIAIIGERKTANEKIYSINYELGKELTKYTNIDEYICITEDPSMIIGKPTSETQLCAIYDGIKENLSKGQKVSLCNNLLELATNLRYQTRKGDLLLFKGRATLGLWCIPDLAFGTWYTKSSVLVPLGLERKSIQTKDYKGEYSKYFGGINLLWGQNGFDNTQLFIPNRIDGKPIARINNRIFKNNSQIRQVIFGTYIRSIGEEAFYNCINLEEIRLPKKCVYLGERAFYNCYNLVSVNALKLQHISNEAFKNCINLKEIFLSETCMTIEDGAFDNCPNLTIKAPVNSYAFCFAKEKGIKVKEIDSEEELFKIGGNGVRSNPYIYSFETREDENIVKNVERVDNSNLSIAFVGDIMAHDIHLNCFIDKETGVYNFDKLFQNTQKYLQRADVAVGNLETTFGPGEYTGFPRFNTPDYLAEAMAKAGFDIAAVANNHMFDSGYAGIIKTKKTLEENGIAVTGIFDEVKNRNYALIEKKGIKIAILNYTYRTYNQGEKKTINLHMLDDKSSIIVNTFSYEDLDNDLENIKNDIVYAKDEADVTIVYFHWGNEYETKANVLQKYMAYKVAQMGADAIIGSHAHVIQEEVILEFNEGEEIKRRVPVFYGLGNYCWGGRLARTARETVQNGMIAFLNINFDKEKRKVVSINTSYKPLYIKNDYIGDKYDFNILSLNDLDSLQREAFNHHNSKCKEVIVEEIEEQLHPKLESKEKYCFDKMLIVEVGEKKNIVDELPIDEKGGKFFSENAIIASVLQIGCIIGNKVGITGMQYISPNGEIIYFVVKVLNSDRKLLPVLINQYNAIYDIYRPFKNVSGKKYYLPMVSLEEEAAKSWAKMYLYAQVNNIHYKAIKGFETKEVQLKSKIKSIENEFDEHNNNILINEKELGRSYHNFGKALDVIATDEDSAKGLDWIKNNAYKFGFAVVKITNDIVHMLYVHDSDFALIIQNLEGNIEKFITANTYYQGILDKRKSWEKRYINSIEEIEDKERWDILTLGRICEIIGVDVPVVYKDIKNRIVPNITITDENIHKGSVFFYDNTLRYAKAKCRNALRNSAAIAITDEIIKDEIGNPVNQIVVDDAWEACGKVCRYLLDKNNCEVIAVEEKNNNRNCINVLNSLLGVKYKTIYSSGLSGSRKGIVNTVQKINNNDEYFLQEIEGANKDFILKNANILKPKLAILTGLKDEFSSYYINKEEYEKDALSLIEVTLAENGTVILNIDEPIFEQYINQTNIKTISKVYKNADYYLVKAVEKKDFIEVTIKIKNNYVNLRIDLGLKEDLTALLAAYAAADCLGLSEYDLMMAPVSKMGVIELLDDELKQLKDSVKLEADKKSITVKWEDTVSDITGYHIRCYNSVGKMIKGMHVYDGTEYQFTGLEPGSNYRIWMRAYRVNKGYKSYSSYFSLNVSTDGIKNNNETKKNLRIIEKLKSTIKKSFRCY